MKSVKESDTNYALVAISADRIKVLFNSEQNKAIQSDILTNANVIELGDLLGQDDYSVIEKNDLGEKLVKQLDPNNSESPLHGYAKVVFALQGAASAIASMLRRNESLSLPKAAECWAATATFLIKARKQQRQRIQLVNFNDLIVKSAKDEHHVLSFEPLKQYFMQDSFALIASAYCVSHSELFKLNEMLVATLKTSSMSVKPLLDLEDCLEHIRSSNDQLKLSVEKIAQLQDESHSFKNENELLLQQLHTVQEALEKENLKRNELDKKLKDQTSVLHESQEKLEEALAKRGAQEQLQKKTLSLTEENELMLQQLHTVQETLEKENLKRNELDKKLKYQTSVLHNTQEKLEEALAKAVAHEQLQEKMQTVTGENALLLQQLHVVQESLEESYERRKALLEQLYPSLSATSETEEGDEDIRTIAQSNYFHPLWYLDNNPDVALAGVNPAEHYLYQGFLEGREPGPRFSGAQYYEANTDVAAESMNPLLHYERHGKQEGRALALENQDDKQS